MNKPRILIVDDKEENRYLLRLLLEGAGLAVAEATHGGEGLTSARATRPDLVISDILMPVMDGFAFCREWKCDPGLRDIPFAFSTATYTDGRDRDFALSIGADDFIVKPQEPEALVERLRGLMRTAAPRRATPPAAPPAEEVFLRQYNETLVRKLETKMEQLEQDIAARKRAEEDLRRTNLFLDSIIENIPTMLFLKDARTLRFVRFNRAGEELLGVSRTELIGKSDHDLFPKEQADFFIRKDREVLAGRTAVDIPEEPLQTRDKGLRLLHTRKVPVLNAAGEPEYLLGISEDITNLRKAATERERLQSELLHAQKLESVGRLAGGIAHDFNNILGAILGYTELLLDGLAPDHPHHSDLVEIRRSAQRAADLTRQLLVFARKQTIAPKALDLNQTVEGILKMLRRLIGENVEIAWQPGRDPEPVLMDPSQLDQILANLCVNASDAIAGSGRITLETSHARFAAADLVRHPECPPGEYAILVVADTGCGMGPEVLDRIFEPFFTTKELGKGTGLGLATVYGIVRQNKGFIDVASEPGRGSTFRIHLPRRAD